MAKKSASRSVRRPAASKASTRAAITGRVSQELSSDQIRKCVQEVLSTFKRMGDPRILSDMSERYGIRLASPESAFGIRVADLQDIAKDVRKVHGRSQALASALWETGIYEARMLACLVGDPKQLTASQMDAWAREFDNWAICDTACFHLFDRTGAEMVMSRIKKWTTSKQEFVRRAGFALLASFALHDKDAAQEHFMVGLQLIRDRSADDRNFVKKAASWALRGIGKRRDAKLLAQSLAVAEHLAASTHPGERWVGQDALREFKKKARSIRKD